MHPDVLAFCRAELLQQNYFHAVLEASKSVADKLRSLANRQETARRWSTPPAPLPARGSVSTAWPPNGSDPSRPGSRP